jgi:hypothetical protein
MLPVDILQIYTLVCRHLEHMEEMVTLNNNSANLLPSKYQHNDPTVGGKYIQIYHFRIRVVSLILDKFFWCRK